MNFIEEAVHIHLAETWKKEAVQSADALKHIISADLSGLLVLHHLRKSIGRTLGPMWPQPSTGETLSRKVRA